MERGRERLKTVHQPRNELATDSMTGEDVNVKCNGDDPIGDLRKLISAQTGRSLTCSDSTSCSLPPEPPDLNLCSRTESKLCSANELRTRIHLENANALSSPMRKQAPSYGFDSSSAVAAAAMNSRSAAFAKRSPSFIDRGFASPGIANSSPMMSSTASNWSSPDGNLDWGVQGEELNKLRKAASSKVASGANTVSAATTADEPDASWVSSLVKDVPPAEDAMFTAEKGQRACGKDICEMLPPWAEHLYREVPRMAA